MKTVKDSAPRQGSIGLTILWGALPFLGGVAIATTCATILAFGLPRGPWERWQILAILLAVLGGITLACTLGVIGSWLLVEWVGRAWSRLVGRDVVGLASRGSLHDEWLDGPG